MTLPLLPPRLFTAFRLAFNMRESGTAKATVDTFIATKGFTAGEVTLIMASVPA